MSRYLFESDNLLEISTTEKRSMSTPNQFKKKQQYLQENIEQYGQTHANQHTNLLYPKEETLQMFELKIQTENKIFWLETFAMFIFIYASTCSKFNTGVDLAFFTGIMMAIPICAQQTGANLNPAVSLSMVLKNNSNMASTMMWIYFKAQVAGAILSMIVTLVLNDVHRSPLYPADDTNGLLLRMILSEIIGVFILIFFVLYATGPCSFIENNGAKYFYIAVFVYIGRRFAAISGNQINLALTISQAFVGIPECNFQGFKYLFIWFIGDALGVYIACQFYNFILEPTASFLQRKRRVHEQTRKVQQSAIQLKNINKK